MSPLLLNIVLDPILRFIEDENVQILGYVDDIALFSNDEDDFRRVFGRLIQTMTNQNDATNLTFTIRTPNGPKIVTLPKLERSQTYIYLGVHFAIDLSSPKHVSRLISVSASLMQFLCRH